METPDFGPRERTREQRQTLAAEAAALNATQGRAFEPFAQQLCDRYVAGELSLAQLIAEVNRVHQKRYPR
jgi:hypothetical protein